MVKKKKIITPAQTVEPQPVQKVFENKTIVLLSLALIAILALGVSALLIKNLISTVYPCTPNWNCSTWPECSINGVQNRTCTDLNSCSSQTIPETFRNCTYSPPINDTPVIRIQNITSMGYKVLDLNFIGFGHFINDSSGYENSGAIVGPGWRFDNYSCLEFEPYNGYVVIPSSRSLNVGNKLSIEVRVKLLSNISSIAGTLLRKLNAYGLEFGDNNKSAVGFFVQPDHTIIPWTNELFSNATISVNTWYHLIATYDGVREKIYINGALDSQREYITDVNLNDEAVYIGSWLGKYFHGRLAMARIYNITLSDDEARELYRMATR